MEDFTESLKRYQRYFKRLILLEREEEIFFHLNEIRSMSGRQREARGRAVLGMTGRDAGMGLGGIYLVKLVRKEGLPDTSISTGDLVIVSRGNPNGREAQATVVEKTGYSVTVAYNQPPSHEVFGRNLRLDLFANDVSFRRMMDALQQLREHQPLVRWLLLREKPEIPDGAEIPVFVQQQLNERQKLSVQNAVSAGGIFLIHGPPGTGKTTTLVEVIIQLTKKGSKVLATADSNTAVDNLVEKLQQVGSKVLRIGNPARVDPSLYNASLDYQLQDNPDFQYAMKLRNDVVLLKEKQQDFVPATGQNRRGLSDEEILKLAKRGNAKRGIPLVKIRKMAGWVRIQKKVNALMNEIRELENQAVDGLISQADVVCATNVSSGADLLRDFRFDVVVLDEATQAMEPSSLIPMTKANKWVLAGDHKQLPPTVLSREASPLNFTLFERWMAEYEDHAGIMLTVQYRMHKKIMRFPNEAFYKGLLKAHPSVQNHHIGELAGFTMPDNLSGPWKTAVDPQVPVCFIHVGSGSEEKISGSYSYFNRAETNVVKEVLHALLACRLFPADIGIISPYEQQVNVLKDEIGSLGVDIKTVDGYQGREKEVIILSLVRANPEGTLGFLTDFRRLNVALTRARRKLIVAGHRPTLETHNLYKKMLESIEVKLTVPLFLSLLIHHVSIMLVNF